MEPSTYCGWTTLITNTGEWIPNSPQENHAFYLQGFWAQVPPVFSNNWPGIENASDNTFAYIGYQSLIPTFAIQGSGGP